MTRRRDLERHRRSLGEIAEIMSSMKTLAYMETRKLARYLDAETRMVGAIDAAAADFLSFEPGLLPEATQGGPLLLVIGSERGFCGDFNRVLADRIAHESDALRPAEPGLIVVGQKMQGSIENDPRIVAFVEGASVADEVGSVLQHVIAEINAVQSREPGLRLMCIHHAAEEVTAEWLLPPFEQHRGARPAHADPALLNLSPQTFMLDLTGQYLLAKMSHMLSTSLMAENDRRVAHLGQAVRHIEDQTRELDRKCAALRQEEIIEEIEVILLSASAFDEPQPKA